MLIDHPQAVADTRRWLERAVIGLNLCPFAKGPHVKGQVHYAVSDAHDRAALMADLAAELTALQAADPERRETTLLIAPWAWPDFLTFHEAVRHAERTVARLGLEGQLQVAPFHPGFQFAGTAPDDITNCTNRSPYPTLHLIRESSIDRAVAAFPEAEAIYEVNMATLRDLGPRGWAALGVGPTPGEREGEAAGGQGTGA